MKKSFLILFIFLISSLNCLYSQQPIDGRWSGNISIMGQDLNIIVYFKTDPDSLRAKIDIPPQNAKDLNLIHVIFKNPKIYFELPAGKTTAVFDGLFKNDSIKGDFTQAGLKGVFYLVHSEEKTDTNVTTETLPYNEEVVTFTNGAQKFEGTLTIPKIQGKHPAVVMITGSGPHNRDEEIFGFKIFGIIADHLTRNGIAVLRYDDRGVGNSTGKSKAQSTTEELSGDVIEAVNYLKTRDDINSKQIGLCGHSEGGIIAPMAAIKSSDIAFIVLIGGTAVKGIDILKEQSKLIMRANGESNKNIKANLDLLDEIYQTIQTNEGWDDLRKKIENNILDNFDNMPEETKKSITDKNEYAKNYASMQISQFKSPWMKYFVDYDPSIALSKLQCPVLALFGEKDLQVPPAQNKQPMENALNKSGNKNYKIIVIPNANHLFQSAISGSPEEYTKLPKEFVPGFLEIITNWILDHVTIVK